MVRAALNTRHTAVRVTGLGGSAQPYVGLALGSITVGQAFCGKTGDSAPALCLLCHHWPSLLEPLACMLAAPLLKPAWLRNAKLGHQIMTSHDTLLVSPCPPVHVHRRGPSARRRCLTWQP